MAEQFSEVEFTSDVGDAVSAALNIDTSLAAFCAALTVSWRIYFLGKLLFWHHVMSIFSQRICKWMSIDILWMEKEHLISSSD